MEAERALNSMTFFYKKYQELFSEESHTVKTVTFLYQRVKANQAILYNAMSLVGTTAVTSGLGFAYWWWAARRFSPGEVGLASAIISAMTLLGTFSIVGLDTLLIGELPRHRGKESSLISAALLFVAGLGLILGIVFALAAPALSNDFLILRTNFGNIGIFAIGVGLTALTLVFDQALIGLLRGGIQLWRNAFFAAAKLVALFIAGAWLAHTTGLTIYATWVIGIALSLVALAFFAGFKGELPRNNYLPHWGLLQKLRFQALKHHMLNLTLHAPSLILPILVTIMLSAETNAWFYVSWSIASIANIASSALTTSLYAASSEQPDTLSRKVLFTLSLSFVATLLANCVLLFAPTQVLSLFGHSYAQQAVWSLRILGLESFPFIIKTHYIAIRRIEGRVTHATLPAIAGGILELGLSALGAYLGGLTGLSLGWLLAVCIEASYMFLPVYKVTRPVEINGRREECAS